MKIRVIKSRKQKISTLIVYAVCISMAATNLDIVLGFDFKEPSSLVGSQIPAISAAKAPESSEISENAPSETSVPPSDELKPVLALDMHASSGSGYLEAGNVMVKNHTAYSPNVASLFKEQLKFNLKQSGPRVLIVHTHTSEAFMPTDSDWYNPSDPSRTQDMNYTVAKVGAEMAKVLNDMGVETIQDREIHDYPSYNGSYKSSLAAVESYLQKYPSIKVVIDVHRDAMVRDDGTKLKNVTEIGGKKVAQVMIVSGTNASGLEHPNWQETLKFAMKWQSQMNSDYPRLTRAIDLREERFNTHTTLASLILEVGSSGTTLEEAIAGGRLAAESLGKMLKTMYN